MSFKCETGIAHFRFISGQCSLLLQKASQPVAYHIVTKWFSREQNNIFLISLQTGWRAKLGCKCYELVQLITYIKRFILTQGHGYLSVVNFVLWKVEARALDWYLIHGNPNECVCVCVIENDQE